MATLTYGTDEARVWEQATCRSLPVPLADIDQESDERLMSSFLDLAWQHVVDNPEELVAYTAEMVAEEDELFAGVELD
jgi:hypothetical protein